MDGRRLSPKANYHYQLRGRHRSGGRVSIGKLARMWRRTPAAVLSSTPCRPPLQPRCIGLEFCLCGTAHAITRNGLLLIRVSFGGYKFRPFWAIKTFFLPRPNLTWTPNMTAIFESRLQDRFVPDRNRRKCVANMPAK